MDAGERRFNAGAHNTPIQTTEAATKRWQGNGPNAVLVDHMHQILHPASMAPMWLLPAPVALGGKIDDVLWVGEGARPENKHGTELHLTPLASLAIGAEILRKRLLELEGNALPRHANTVDRIDEGFSVLGKDGASGETHGQHWLSWVKDTTVSEPESGACEGPSQACIGLDGKHFRSTHRCAGPVATEMIPQRGTLLASDLYSSAIALSPLPSSQFPAVGPGHNSLQSTWSLRWTG